jgi:hypothetical protein
MTGKNQNGFAITEEPIVSGRLRYTIYKKGIPIEQVEDNNLIVNGPRLRLARLIAGDKSLFNSGQLISGLHIDKIAVGTSGNVTTVDDTEITEAFAKPVDRFDYPEINKTRFFWRILESEANGKAIKEFGLLTVDGTLFARRFRATAINKESDISIDGEWTITFG